MNFASKKLDQTTTICAIATPMGKGAVALVRLSGNRALPIIQSVFSNKEIKDRVSAFGKIYDGDKVLDHCVVTYFKAPRSFTGEDVIEIGLHGGLFLQKRMLDLLVEKGAQLAEPGQFSLRAVLNGKMDLVQAEAIQQLIFAKSEKARKAAQQQLDGVLSKKIQTFQKQLIDIYALLEAWVDFPEEDLEFRSFDDVIKELTGIYEAIEHLLNTFDEGERLFLGVTLCLVGPPNAGKSTLLNLLLKKERAIVSEIAGTTRDFLQEELVLFDYPVRLIDTAGIREAKDQIEKMGVERSKVLSKNADINLVVFDINAVVLQDFLQFLSHFDKERTLVVWNKCDLKIKPPVCLEFPSVEISCKSGTNVDRFYHLLEKMIKEKGIDDQEEVLLTNKRHALALKEANEHLQEVIIGIKQQRSAECVVFDLKKALEALSTVIGQDIQNALLDAIFSQFCLGK
jgi:tRNA modification GTPase